ncbi:P-loop containing nucleoside triphosphate hydrolase protein, partial [Nadsonia fulvescens var. elongata DSM 6958]
MQSLCFNEFFGTTANCVVSSPTGSGKTVLFELAILKLFQITGCFEKLFNAFTISDSSFKVVYIAPTKSLCVERAADWSRKFQILGLSCKALTGDTSLDELANDKRANIIVTTPEKWDFITRKWADNKLLIGCVKLFMIDEIHTLREGRGATLEVIVSRMKAMTQHDLRFVALSATVPNIGDIATWLTQDKYHPNSPATTRIFGDEFRPVKLCKFVYGYNNSNSGGNSYAKQFYMDKTFSKKLPELIKKHGESKPILIFCSTRNIAITTAKFLASYHNQTSISWRSRLWKRPDCNSFNFKNHELKSFAKDGVAFHHAGLDFQDRHMVEQGFIAKDLSIVCCTSTLAVGTNLPAHTVIIKGTKFWSGNDLREHNELEVIQMIGRAGRPQFDNIGTAIIMTTNDKRVLYESLVRGTQAIESCLHLNLMDHFVAEVSLGTIFSLKSAVVWLKSTFLYTRLRKNPAFYPNVISAKYKIKPDIDDKNIENFCEQLISDLIRDKLIKNLAQTDPIELVCTNFGTSMSQHYMKYETMKSIIEFNTKTNKRNYPLLINDILTFLSKSAEFKEFKLKHAEKKLYKDLNQAEGIRFPIKSAVIREDWQKISILIQTELGGVEYSHYEGARNNYLGYMCDKSMVIKHAERILRCLIDCFCQRSDSNSIKSALELYRSLQGRSWEDLPLILRQLEGIGPAFVQKFIAHNIQSFTDLRALENNRIESLLGINKDSSVKITEDLEGIPHFAIEAEQLGIFEFQSTRKFSSKDSYLKVTIKVKAQYLNSPTVPIWHQKRMNAIIITETSDGILLDFRRVPVARLKDSLEFEIKATIAYSSQAIESHIYCETVAGVSESY